MDPNLQPDSGRSGFCSRLKASIGQPERLQPTILAIGLTYIVYTISAMAGFVTVSPAVTQFTYYCCILGLASAIVFYLKFCCDESYSTFWLLIYNSILVLVILFYVGHWFVKPQFGEKTSNGTDVIRNRTQIDFQRPPPPRVPDATTQMPVKTTTVKPTSVKLTTAKATSLKPTTVRPITIQNQTTDRQCGFERVKCSPPLHLVLQVAFMMLILASLTANIFV